MDMSPEMQAINNQRLAAFARQLQGSERGIDDAMARSNQIRELQMQLLQQFLSGDLREQSLALQQQRLLNQQ